jgi:transcriptional regulator GlxA family with amidase domain
VAGIQEGHHARMSISEHVSGRRRDREMSDLSPQSGRLCARIIDHGDIITAGGFLSWVDIGLLLVDRILGPAIRAEMARFVLADPGAGEARYFTGFAPPQTHGDRAGLKAQGWVHMRDGRSVSLAAMATAAGLERRTLLRGSRVQRA